MQTWAGMLVETGKAIVDPFATTTQMKVDSDFWTLPFLTSLCCRTFLVIIKHPEDGNGIAQMDNSNKQVDYFLVRKRFRSGVNSARTRSFPEAHIGSDHDLLMMTYLRLKRISKPKHTRLKFDLEKLKDSNVLETFQAMIGGKFAPLTIMISEDTDMNSVITTFNTATIGTSSDILGKHRQKENKTGPLQKFLISATKGEN